MSDQNEKPRDYLTKPFTSMQLDIDDLKAERDAALARAEKYKAALNKIGMLSMSGIAYTREFTEQVETITREALNVPKKWPY